MKKIILSVFAIVLTFSFALAQDFTKITSHKAPDNQDKAIENAQVVTDDLYITGDNIITFTLTFESPDVEFADGFSMTFPAGVTINEEGTSAAISSAGINPIDGQTVSWGDMAGGSGWGGISYSEPRVFDVSITVDETVSGNMDVDWLLIGDGYGADPHFAEGIVTINPALDYDMSVSEIGFPETISYNETVEPTATVNNIGNNNADFTITITVTNQEETEIYSDSHDYIDFASGNTEIVEFADFFYAIPGQYTVNVTIDYVDDENIDNNIIEQDLVIMGFGDGWIFAEGTIPTLSYLGASAQHGNDLYILGGNTPGDNNEVSIYNVETESWSAGTPLPGSSVIGQAITVGDIIYVTRGINVDVPSADFWAYDTNTDTWSTLASLPQGRSWGSLTAIGDDIYFVGGRDETVAVSDVYRYDVGTDTWTTATSTPRPAWGGSLTSLNGKLYYFLGLDADNLISEVLIGEINDTDPDDITWTTSNTFPGAPVFKFVAKPFSDNTIIFAGGNDGAGESFWHGTPDTWLYNVDDDTWQQLADKNIPINSHGAGIFQDGGNTKFVVAAGYDSNSGAEISEVEYYLEAEYATHIDPTERDFIIDEANDVFTTVFWMSAESVVSVNDGTDDLIADTDYEVVDHNNGTATLTVFGTYLSTVLLDPADEDLVLEITFDNDNIAHFTIHPAALSVVSVDPIDDMTFLMGTAFADLTLPATVNVHLNNLDEITVDITWLEGDYDPNTAGVQTLYGDLDLGTIENPDNLQAEIDLHIEYVATSIIEDFEEYEAGTGVIPPYWDAERFSVFPTGGVDDSQRLSANLYGTTYNSGYWETPIIDIGSNPKFNFMYRLVNWSGYPETATPAEHALLEFYVSDDLGETFTLVHTIDENNHTVTTDYAYVEVDMSSYVDDHVIIRVEGNSLDGDFYADFDNLMIGTFYTTSFTVTDPDMNPIQDAEVSIFEDGSTEPAFIRYTDENGDVSFELSDNTDYSYEITSFGFIDQDDIFSIAGADMHFDIVLDPIPTYSVQGIVKTNDAPDDVFIEGALVTLTGYDEYSVTTNVDGEFLIEDIFEGSYDLSISYAGYETHTDIILVDADLDLGEIILTEIIEDPYALVVDVDHTNQSALFSWNSAESWSDSFEDGVIPEGWTQIITNSESTAVGDCTWQVTGTVEFDPPLVPQDGTYQAFIMWSYSHQDEWLITPEFTAPQDDLVFWYHGYNGSPNLDNYYVKVSNDGGNNWDILWNASDLPEGENHYEVPAIIDLSAYAGQDIQIAWNNVDGDGEGLWYAWAIDNISVGEMKIDVKDLMHVSNSEPRTGTNQAAKDGLFRKPVNPEDMLANTRNTKEFLGFNVYLDGSDTPENTELIPEDTPMFEFADLTIGLHTAGVEAIYSTGISNTVEIDFEVLDTYEVTFEVAGDGNGALTAEADGESIVSGDL
ncbi:MAG: choice-of-anchor J domain-containing protein, partial [Bacteroidales bacterium]